MLKDFYYDYLSINPKDYGIGIDVEICKVFFIVMIGLCVAVVWANFNKANIFTVIKQLIRHEAYGESSAKSLKDLGFSDNRMVKYALSHPGQLTKLVARVGEVKPTYEEYVAAEKKAKQDKKLFKQKKKEALYEYEMAVKEARAQGLTPPPKPVFTKPAASVESLDFETALFYIPDATRDRCKHVFDNSSVSVMKTVLAVAFLVIAYVLLVLLMPDILNLLSRIITN